MKLSASVVLPVPGPPRVTYTRPGSRPSNSTLSRPMIRSTAEPPHSVKPGWQTPCGRSPPQRDVLLRRAGNREPVCPDQRPLRSTSLPKRRHDMDAKKVGFLRTASLSADRRGLKTKTRRRWPCGGTPFGYQRRHGDRGVTAGGLSLLRVEKCGFGRAGRRATTLADVDTQRCCQTGRGTIVAPCESSLQAGDLRAASGRVLGNEMAGAIMVERL